MRKYLLLLFVIVSLMMFTACLHQAAAPSMQAGAASYLEGRITLTESGQPVEGAFVYAYRDTNTHFFGPPNFLSSPSSKQGLYTLELDPGKYYIFARKRKTGSFQGPLYKDDLFSNVDQGVATVQPGKKTVNFSIQKLTGQQFYRPEKFAAKTETIISGRILDQKGNPVMGAFAFAYRNGFMKRVPPHYGSVASDMEGRYSLYLDEGGKFIVGARVRAKEPPEQGELLGFYQDSKDKLISVSSGVKKGNVDIILKPFTGTPEIKPVVIPGRQ